MDGTAGRVVQAGGGHNPGSGTGVESLGAQSPRTQEVQSLLTGGQWRASQKRPPRSVRFINPGSSIPPEDKATYNIHTGHKRKRGQTSGRSQVKGSS